MPNNNDFLCAFIQNNLFSQVFFESPSVGFFCSRGFSTFPPVAKKAHLLNTNDFSEFRLTPFLSFFVNIFLKSA